MKKIMLNGIFIYSVKGTCRVFNNQPVEDVCNSQIMI